MRKKKEISYSEVLCRFESTCWQEEEGLDHLLWGYQFASSTGVGISRWLGCVIKTVAI